MKRFLIVILILLTLFIFGFAQDKKVGLITIGMSAGDVAEAFRDGSRPVVNPSFKPKGVATEIKTKGVHLEFLHDRLYSITYDTKFDLSISPIPFREKQYNIPTIARKSIHWRMPFEKFKKTLDSWSKELSKAGMTLVKRSDEYVENTVSRVLKDQEFLMSMLHPARHEYWVQFGPAVESSLPRVTWSFSFDPQDNTLIKIGILDRDKEGPVLIKIQ
ncbi:MAG: hypothetical protein NPIRA05_12170 [Nitrospirales bacterium]|nr:MAG: hypothetical protein NPIRA05_12170 [Nitrospirales bacterium]